MSLSLRLPTLMILIETISSTQTNFEIFYKNIPIKIRCDASTLGCDASYI